MTAPNRVLLMQLSERTSARGNRYLAGWLGKASVVAFEADEPDRYGNKVWEVFVSTPEPRAEGKPAAVPDAAEDGPARAAQEPVERGQGWKGSAYRRPRPGAPTAPLEALDDGLEDIGR